MLKVFLITYLSITIICMICLSIQVYRFNTCMNMLESGQSNKSKWYDIFLSILVIIIESIIPIYNICLIVGSFKLSKEEVMELAIKRKIKDLK